MSSSFASQPLKATPTPLSSSARLPPSSQPTAQPKSPSTSSSPGALHPSLTASSIRFRNFREPCKSSAPGDDMRSQQATSSKTTQPTEAPAKPNLAYPTTPALHPPRSPSILSAPTGEQHSDDASNAPSTADKTTGRPWRRPLTQLEIGNRHMTRLPHRWTEEDAQKLLAALREELGEDRWPVGAQWEKVRRRWIAISGIPDEEAPSVPAINMFCSTRGQKGDKRFDSLKRRAMLLREREARGGRSTSAANSGAHDAGSSVTSPGSSESASSRTQGASPTPATTPSASSAAADGQEWSTTEDEIVIRLFQRPLAQQKTSLSAAAEWVAHKWDNYVGRGGCQPKGASQLRRRVKSISLDAKHPLQPEAARIRIHFGLAADPLARDEQQPSSNEKPEEPPSTEGPPAQPAPALYTTPAPCKSASPPPAAPTLSAEAPAAVASQPSPCVGVDLSSIDGFVGESAPDTLARQEIERRGTASECSEEEARLLKRLAALEADQEDLRDSSASAWDDMVAERLRLNSTMEEMAEQVRLAVEPVTQLHRVIASLTDTVEVLQQRIDELERADKERERIDKAESLKRRREVEPGELPYAADHAKWEMERERGARLDYYYASAAAAAVVPAPEGQWHRTRYSSNYEEDHYAERLERAGRQYYREEYEAQAALRDSHAAPSYNLGPPSPPPPHYRDDDDGARPPNRSGSSATYMAATAREEEMYARLPDAWPTSERQTEAKRHRTEEPERGRGFSPPPCHHRPHHYRCDEPYSAGDTRWRERREEGHSIRWAHEEGMRR